MALRHLHVAPPPHQLSSPRHSPHPPTRFVPLHPLPFFPASGQLCGELGQPGGRKRRFPARVPLMLIPKDLLYEPAGPNMLRPVRGRLHGR